MSIQKIRLERTHPLAADGTCALLPELARRAALEEVPELQSFVTLLQAGAGNAARAGWSAGSLGLSRMPST